MSTLKKKQNKEDHIEYIQKKSRETRKRWDKIMQVRGKVEDLDNESDEDKERPEWSWLKK